MQRHFMLKEYITEIRAFNRFYTNIIGLLDRHFLNSNYTLPEVRVLYELYHHEQILANEITALIDIDKGYLSRILLQLGKKKLIAKKRSPTDGRAIYLSLTVKGRKEFEVLDTASENQVKQILTPLSKEDQANLAQYMSHIRTILTKTTIN
jgi:DNA-binding MarR family transcriptional regulator